MSDDPSPRRSPGPPSEFPDYYAPYVALHPGGDPVDALADQLPRALSLLASVPLDRGTYRYDEGKWSAAEVVGHVVDIERVFATRAMCFLRGLGDLEQPGVDQDVMVPRSGADARGLSSLTAEFEHLRRANVALFEALDDRDLAVRGLASGTEFDVRTVLAILYGHVEHHLDVLRERYL